MAVEAIFIGILIGLIYYEIVGLTPGGIVVPGYIALYFAKPYILLSTFAAALLTYVLIKLISQFVILYGRRAFVAAVVIGFLLKWIFSVWLIQVSWMPTDLEIIGYIIPGLLANEMRKQGIFETVFSCVIVSGFVAILIQVYNYF